MSSYQDELGWAYQGEVYGEAMFAAMAEAVEDRDRSAQLGLMALIERQTKEQLAPLCAREGVIVDDAAHQEQGRGVAERVRRPNWDHERFLRSFTSITVPALVRYQRMRDVLAPPGDATTMAALVTHEVVLQSFADGLLDGRAEPAAALLDALEGEHRQAADALLRAAERS